MVDGCCNNGGDYGGDVGWGDSGSGDDDGGGDGLMVVAVVMIGQNNFRHRVGSR